jgi:hypothetical protein
VLRSFGGTPRDKVNRPGPVTLWSATRAGTRYKAVVDGGTLVDELELDADGLVPPHAVDLPDVDTVLYWEFADGTRKRAHPGALPDRVAWLEEQVVALGAELTALRAALPTGITKATTAAKGTT